MTIVLFSFFGLIFQFHKSGEFVANGRHFYPGKVSNIFQPGGVENRVTEKNLPMGRVFIFPNITLSHSNSRCGDLSCGKYFLFCDFVGILLEKHFLGRKIIFLAKIQHMMGKKKLEKNKILKDAVQNGKKMRLINLKFQMK